MKNLKQIREQVEVVKENVDASDRNLTTLVRAGLYDPKKIPMLKRALDKDNAKVTPQERKALLDLLDNLLSQVVTNKSVYSKVKQNLQSKTVNEESSVGKDTYSKEFSRGKVPALLILKRKAIRQYPDATVALYYSDTLKKLISIPFSDIGVGDITEELKTYDDLKENIIDYLKKLDESEQIKFKDGTVLLVTQNMAKKVLGVYENLNKTNKQQMLSLLSEDKDSFIKIVNFALDK